MGSGSSSLASKVKDASVTELQGVVTNLPPEDRDKVKAALDLVPRPPKNCRRRVKCGGKTFAPFGLRDDFQPPDPAKTKDFTPYQPEDGLPEKVDLRNFMSPIEDQSQTNSCCANAVAGAFEYINCKHAGETGDTRGDVSRLFIYYVGRKKDMADEGAMWGKKNSKRAPKDEGMTIQAAISAMQVSGACLAESWPYDLDKVNEKPGEECFKEAQRYRVLAAERVPMDLDAMRQCLARGNPIIFGLMLTDSFFRPGRGGFVSTPNKTDKRAAQHGLHAMLLVGYNDRQQVFIVRNSWGESWGDRGYGYVGYDYIANMDYNFLQQFTITGLTNADFTPGPDDGEDFDITDNTDDVVIEEEEEPEEPDADDDFDFSENFKGDEVVRQFFLQEKGVLSTPQFNLVLSLFNRGDREDTFDELAAWEWVEDDSQHPGKVEWTPEDFNEVVTKFAKKSQKELYPNLAFLWA
ncbi:unnamed protein product [Durusdinium trenchii]|uniref:Peptidase C1A papain C-terminal domain-containing protein n=2 Tax=Durusdinium trenchii TaxID=1381693 RepID=A0ABP0PRD9_9DINO